MKIVSRIIYSLAITIFLVIAVQAQNNDKAPSLEQNKIMYQKVTEGIHITAGAWRPLFGTEQVAWINPAWSSEGYIWLDFPEAIFYDNQLIYLGHIDERFPAKYNNLPTVKWQEIDNGIQYERELPNGVKFGGSVVKKDDNTVGLKIWIYNGSSKTIKDIKLQTCAYLNQVIELDEKTNLNKLVHIPEVGWIPLSRAQRMEDLNSKYHVGWLGGPKVSDLPVIIALSEDHKYLVGMTWYDNTYSLIGNENHPCYHVDPFFPNLKPGQKYTINGEMIFFDGSIKDFEKMFRERMKAFK